MTEPIRRTSRRGVIRRSAYAAVPLAAVAVAYLAARNDGAAGALASHEHAVTQSAAQTVMLTAEQARRIGVTYAVASLDAFAREIRTVGQVTFDETRVTAISLKVDGWVEHLHVNFSGQAVEAGAPLLAIYSPMLVSAQEELLLARRLEGDVAAGADDARASARSLSNSARQRLERWDVPPGDITRIERTGQVERAVTLRAPTRGFVIDKNVVEGQRIMAGDLLYRLADLTHVWIEGEVFERDLSAVRLGQRVRVQLDAIAGGARYGRITYIHPTLDPETRTVRIRVQLPNPGLLLKPGMYATLTWSGSQVATLSVPRTAVVATGQRNLVFVKRPDGMLEPRLIDVGMSTSERVEVRSGLAAGDTIVKSATFLVDAESNLATLLGGMGDMPGMDMTAPTPPEGPRARPNH